MKHVFTLKIAGPARGKARTRPSFSKQGVFIKPKADRVAEADIHAAWREAGEPRCPEDVALAIKIEISTVRPGSHRKKSGDLSAEGERQPIPRKAKPDVDNVLKLIMDVLNKRAWRDDVMVASAHVVRKWADWPETVIHVYALHD